MELHVSKPDSLFYPRSVNTYEALLDPAQCVDVNGGVCRAIKTSSGVNGATERTVPSLPQRL